MITFAVSQLQCCRLHEKVNARELEIVGQAKLSTPGYYLIAKKLLHGFGT